MMTTTEVATELGVAAATVRSWRNRGMGPEYQRIGGPGSQVFYDPATIKQYKEIYHG